MSFGFSKAHVEITTRDFVIKARTVKFFGILNWKFVYSPFVKATSGPLPVGTIIAESHLSKKFFGD